MSLIILGMQRKIFMNVRRVKLLLMYILHNNFNRKITRKFIKFQQIFCRTNEKNKSYLDKA